MDNFTFSPSTGFNDTSVYTDPASGTQARQQLMSLHTQTQTFINDQLVDAVNTINNSISSIQADISGTGGIDDKITALQGSVSTLNNNVYNLQQAVNNFAIALTSSTITANSSLRVVVSGDTYEISVSGGSVIATQVVG